ncbi:MAG: ABC transporter ATP-binding protein [Paracoccaceae bacterium]
MTPPGLRIAGRASVGDMPLFGELELICQPGAWTCLLGASGVGKTTLLRLAAGLATGVAFQGDVTASDGASLDGRIAYMAQADLLFPWLDVTGNVMLGARLRGEPPDPEKAADLVKKVGLSADTAKRPAQLSGGMRQRAALARTLMEDRPVVLLDEAFSALDARTRAEMQELSAELLAGRTVLQVTHEPAEAARLGHAIFVMNASGLGVAATPSSSPIRAYDDPDVFACQSALMAQIREAA